MFLDPLVDESTVTKEDSKYIINEDFNPTVTKEVRKWAEDSHAYLRKRKGRIPLRSCVTGPFTLASNIRVKGMEAKPFPRGYAEIISERPWVLEKLTKYVKKICRHYSVTSSMISIDEPFLSILVGKRKNLLEMEMSRSEAYEVVVEVLDTAIGGIKSISALHVCGRIGKRLSEMLMNTDAQILSHEFSSIPENFESYPNDRVEEYSKMICCGVVTTTPTEDESRVEPVELVKKRMMTAIDHYSRDLVLFSPDCGFRSLRNSEGEKEGYRIAMDKIENMVKARGEVATALDLKEDEGEVS